MAHLLRKGEKFVTSKESGKRILESTTGGKRRCIFFGKGCCKNVRVKSSREKRKLKRSSKVEVPVVLSKEIILGHPCIPCARLTRVTIRDGSENKGAELVRGGGRGRYEAQRVKGGFHVITCNLTQRYISWFLLSLGFESL